MEMRGENEEKCGLFGNKAALTLTQKLIPPHNQMQVDSELYSCRNRTDNQVWHFPADSGICVRSVVAITLKFSDVTSKMPLMVIKLNNYE